jgi:acetolactate synthase-1/2/3 large subunit
MPRETIARPAAAERPVLMAGTGVRAAHALEDSAKWRAQLAIPVTTAWTHDLIATDDPLFCGRPGTIGQRAGNFTVQNADALLVLGSRLNIRQVSYNWASFARNAFLMQVDVDAAELDKPTVRPDLPVHCDLKVFLQEMLRQLPGSYRAERHASWLSWCRERVNGTRGAGKHRGTAGPVNPYHFIEELFATLAGDDVVICGNAAACIVPYQAARLQVGQRLISNSGAASMGYDLPAAVGAAVGREGKRVIWPGRRRQHPTESQELQTIAHHQLPIKIFVLITADIFRSAETQARFFGKLVGESPASGISFPDLTSRGGLWTAP